MTLQFQKAVRTQLKARMAIDGPSGAGKTYTSLIAATVFAGDEGHIAVIDTERGSASLYADQFAFDVLELDHFDPLHYVEAIHAAQRAGYDVLIIDSLSHAWEGEGGALDQVDKNAARLKGNSFAAWRTVTPKQGKVVYVGSSNFAGWDIATACQEASKRGLMGLVSEQSIYHLDNRMIELEVIPACRNYGLGLIPWSPLAGGLLGGAQEKSKSGRRKSEAFEKQVEEKREQLEQYEGLCKQLGHPPAEVALAWLLHNPVVTAPIIGPRTMEQLESAVRAASIELDQETLAKLDEIFPGPGGEAPMAYAW